MTTLTELHPHLRSQTVTSRSHRSVAIQGGVLGSPGDFRSLNSGLETRATIRDSGLETGATIRDSGLEARATSGGPP